jgi:hypothetical protein
MFNSCIISLIYVGIGTFSIIGMYPQSPFYWDLSYLGFLLTFPVSVFGFGVIYSEPDSYGLVLIVQLCVFFVFWWLLYKFMLKRMKKKPR